MEKFEAEKLMKEAMKAGDQATLMVVRNVKAKMLLIKTSEGRKAEGPLTDEEIQGCLRKEIREIKEHLESTQKALEGLEESKPMFAEYRKQCLEDEKALNFLNQYLPQNLSDEEALQMVTGLLAEGKKMPEIMKHFSTNYKGRVDMQKISQWAKG